MDFMGTRKSDEFSLRALAAWLEKQPPETQYCYSNLFDCLLSRFVRATGGRVEPGSAYVFGSAWFSCWRREYPITKGPAVSKEHWRMHDIANSATTYGQALELVRSCLAKAEAA